MLRRTVFPTASRRDTSEDGERPGRPPPWAAAARLTSPLASMPRPWATCRPRGGWTTWRHAAGLGWTEAHVAARHCSRCGGTRKVFLPVRSMVHMWPSLHEGCTQPTRPDRASLHPQACEPSISEGADERLAADGGPPACILPMVTRSIEPDGAGGVVLGCAVLVVHTLHGGAEGGLIVELDHEPAFVEGQPRFRMGLPLSSVSGVMVVLVIGRGLFARVGGSCSSDGVVLNNPRSPDAALLWVPATLRPVGDG